MDTPAIQALMESAAAEPAAQPPQLSNALQAVQVASGLDSLPIHALQPMAGLPGFPALMNPAQAAAMGNMGQAAAAMHMLGAGAGAGTARRPSFSKANKGGPLVCQVEGCGAALDNLKEYHQRYKVCEEHLKIPFIIRDGMQVRFCQQCGRFQPLEDFDGEKRSCRVRLQRHNARRRKRPRDGEDGSGADMAAFDAAAASAAAAVEMAKLAAYVPPPMPISAEEMQAMQDALQFASATLMHAGQAPPKPAGEEGGSEGDAGAPGGSEGGGGEGDLGAGSLAPNSMPFVPTVDVMMLLLKGYAAMFHYVLEGATIRPLAPPSELPEQQAVAAAGLAGMDPHQMTQLMQAQGFLPGAALPFSLPGSEVAAGLLGAEALGAAAAAGAQQQQQQQQEEEEEEGGVAGDGEAAAAAGQQEDGMQDGAAAGGGAATIAGGLTPEQVAAAASHAALAAALAQGEGQQAAGEGSGGEEAGEEGD